MRTVLPLFFLLACGGSGDSATTAPAGTVVGFGTYPGTGSTTTPSGSGVTTTTVTGGWECRSDIPASELHGGYPNEELALPNFTAYNYTGLERHKPDLQGHVTVMWFYPAASTSG